MKKKLIEDHMMDTIDDHDISSVRADGYFIHSFGAQVEMTRLKMNGMDPFLWLSQQKRGDFILSVFNLKCVDHCVVVNMSEKFIIDSVGKTYLNFSIDMLNMCVGSDAEGLHIFEVRQAAKHMGNNSVKDDTLLELDGKGGDVVKMVQNSSGVVEIVDLRN